MQQRCTALQQSLPGLSEAAGSFAAASSQLASRRAENKQLLSRSIQCFELSVSGAALQAEAALDMCAASIQNVPRLCSIRLE